MKFDYFSKCILCYKYDISAKLKQTLLRFKIHRNYQHFRVEMFQRKEPFGPLRCWLMSLASSSSAFSLTFNLNGATCFHKAHDFASGFGDFRNSGDPFRLDVSLVRKIENPSGPEELFSRKHLPRCAPQPPSQRYVRPGAFRVLVVVSRAGVSHTTPPLSGIEHC